MIYIGIDPGRSGGLALINGDIVLATPMPETERDIYNLVEFWNKTASHGIRAAIEHVWSTPGQGGAFKFGRNVGHLQMALTAARIPFDQVLPKAWQRALGVAYPPGSTDTEKKNITKRRAQQLFPAFTPITHAIADALLIAEYCRRVRGTNGQEESRRPETVKEARGEGPQQAASSKIGRLIQSSRRQGTT